MFGFICGILKVLITWNQAGLRVVTATTEHALRSAELGPDRQKTHQCIKSQSLALDGCVYRPLLGGVCVMCDG